jgi:hypothetical protein
MLPNILSIKLTFPKKTYSREEQIYFTAISNKDGFLWLFALNKNEHNLFFPNKSDNNNEIKAFKVYSFPSSKSYVLKTKSTVGKETIIGIITETNNPQYAYNCLKKVAPEVPVKISLIGEELWGYDQAVLNIE